MYTISATVGSTSITLSDYNPFGILSATGMGGADIRRVSIEGPAQDGDTDVGYRLGPREMELVIGFKATTDALLDANRDTLTSFFKPMPSTPVKLRVVRDDAEIRQIDCYVVGNVKIDLVPEYRPGHYHRATVRLRAADPAWYELAPGTASFSGTVPNTANWWLAGGAIGSAQHLMHGGTPGTAEAWSYALPISESVGFTLMARADPVSYQNPRMFMFDAPTIPTEYVARFGRAGTVTYGTSYPYFVMGANIDALGDPMSAGRATYFYIADPNAAVGYDVAERTKFLNAGGPYTYLGNLSHISGTTQQWRTGGWPGTIHQYALYSPPLSEGQRHTLDAWVQGVSGTVNQILSLAYEGDLPEYPVISLTGPISGPIVTNTATDESLNFGTYVIGAGTTYVIDTRYGYKTVTQGTSNKIDQLSDDSDLATWHLAPAPVATGGTNTIAVYGSAIGSATTISVVYYNRFMSF